MRINFFLLIALILITNIQSKENHLQIKTNNTLNNTLFSSSTDNSKSTESIIQKDFASYILNIKYPSSIEQKPYLWAYYKGYRLEIDGDLCIINQQQPLNFLTIVITNQLKTNSQEKSIQYLERTTESPCKIFFIKPKYNQDTQMFNDWAIEEESQQNLPLRLPEDALVLLINPEFVQAIKYDKVGKAEHINSSVIYLPEIIIKEDLTQDELDNAIVYSYTVAPDLAAIHVSPKREIKVEKGRIVELKPLER